MHKAVLLYNPGSGGRRKGRQKELDSVVALLRGAGVEASLVLTDSSSHAEEQTRQAMGDGCDTVFACGGDGTVHNILQVLANSNVSLAILPMGTANALAHDLGLAMNPLRAAKAALDGTQRRVALGHVKYIDLHGNSGTRYFVVAAGVGVDAHLFYKLNPEVKQRLGMSAYYVKAWHLWWSYPMPRFIADYIESGFPETKRATLTELLGVRIRHFGGVLRELAPGASLERNDIRLILCHTARRLAYLAYVTRTLLRLKWTVPGIELAHSTKISCRYPDSSSSETLRGQQNNIYVEADGELLGTLPAEITVVPGALTLVAPAT
jgi:diacylglycerol kinase (ATP)